MKKSKIYIFPVLLAILFSGCGLMPLDEEYTSERYEIEGCGFLQIKNNININLFQDSLNYVVVHAPKSVQEDVRPEVFPDSLVLWNRNGGRLINKYDYDVHVDVHFSDISTLFLLGSGTILTIDTLRLDGFSIWFNKSYNKLDMDVDIDNLHLGVSTGSASIDVSGKARNLSVWSTSYAYLDFSELRANKVSVRNNGTNDVLVWPQERLTSLTQYVGNVFYIGSPKSVEIERTGEGETLPFE